MAKSNSSTGLAVLFFILSLSFAFGIGYKLGQQSIPHSPVVSSPVPVHREAAKNFRNSASIDRLSNRIAPPAGKSAMMWMAVGKNKYTLYLASFQRVSDAEKEKTRLESRGLKGIEITERRGAGQIPSRSVSSGPLWYRLSYGRFETKEDAVAYGRQLTERGLIQDFWPKELL